MFLKKTDIMHIMTVEKRVIILDTLQFDVHSAFMLFTGEYLVTHTVQFYVESTSM